MSSFEEALRQVVREELAQRDERLVQRLLDAIHSSTKSEDRLIGKGDDLFGYAWATVRDWVAAGKLKRYGTPRRALVSERELRELLARGVPDGTLNDAKIHDMALARARRK